MKSSNLHALVLWFFLSAHWLLGIWEGTDGITRKGYLALLLFETAWHLWHRLKEPAQPGKTDRSPDE